MGQDTKIEWCHHTFNPWIGCTKVSAGCTHCYAEALMDTRWGKVKWGPNGTRQRTSKSNWQQPLKWDREARQAGERRRVFCASLADVFEDRPELVPWRNDLFKLIMHTPDLDWLLLTKRPENVLRMMVEAGLYAVANPSLPCPQPNLWLGTSVEDQARADERIPHLLRCPASVRFLSCEPLLGAVDLRLDSVLLGNRGGHGSINGEAVTFAGIDWVIIGGESGPGAREMEVAWARSLVEQCAAAELPCFVKQLGAKPMEYPTIPLHRDGGGVMRDPKGGDPDEWPEDLRVREFPNAAAPAGAGR